jgi:hypothetical protein
MANLARFSHDGLLVAKYKSTNDLLRWKQKNGVEQPRSEEWRDSSRELACCARNARKGATPPEGIMSYSYFRCRLPAPAYTGAKTALRSHKRVVLNPYQFFAPQYGINHIRVPPEISVQSELPNLIGTGSLPHCPTSRYDVCEGRVYAGNFSASGGDDSEFTLSGRQQPSTGKLIRGSFPASFQHVCRSTEKCMTWPCPISPWKGKSSSELAEE